MSVMEKIKGGATILDVRTPDEYKDGGYPGSINIPVQELGARIGEVPKGKPIVVYCAAGRRAQMALDMLKAAGHEDVTNGGGLRDMPR